MFKYTDSSLHCFVLANICIPTGDTILSVNIIEFKYILTRRNMLDTKSYIPNYFLKVFLFFLKICNY